MTAREGGNIVIAGANNDEVRPCQTLLMRIHALAG
jgi:hypothetical protein